MHIVSVSRRTDIPAFYSKWFLNRLRAGFCEWLNPFGGQVYRVSLLPEDVLGFVFWTRHPGPMLDCLDDLQPYSFYFHVSINGYGKPLETHNPPVEKAVRSFRALSDRISPDLVLWRYDPIVLSDATPVEYHLRQFEKLARELGGFTKRCYTSFLDTYGKTQRNLARIESIVFEDPDVERRRVVVSEMHEIAASYGIRIYACCEDSVVGNGIEKAHCVDLELLGQRAQPKHKPTRKECGCVASVDIGAYDTCRFGCTYCYATNSRKAAGNRARAHDPEDRMLWRPASRC